MRIIKIDADTGFSLLHQNKCLRKLGETEIRNEITAEDLETSTQLISQKDKSVHVGLRENKVSGSSSVPKVSGVGISSGLPRAQSHNETEVDDSSFFLVSNRKSGHKAVKSYKPINNTRGETPRLRGNIDFFFEKLKVVEEDESEAVDRLKQRYKNEYATNGGPGYKSLECQEQHHEYVESQTKMFHRGDHPYIKISGCGSGLDMKSKTKPR
ncbi:hypothetical protein Bca4012_020960 [Brassica carinata]